MNKVHIYLFRTLLFLCISIGGHAWYTWNLNALKINEKVFVYFLFFCVSFFYKTREKIRFTLPLFFNLSIIVFVLANLFPVIGVTTIPFAYFQIFPLLILYLDRENIDAHRIILSKLWAFLLLMGLIVHISNSYINWLYFPISLLDGEISDLYFFNNYFVLIQPIVTKEFPRFSSVMLEPGYLGTFLAFMLYVNKYDLRKWYNSVFVISLLSSFSLAGIIISVVGYLIYCIQSNKNVIGIIMSIFICLFCCWLSTEYNDGNNSLNRLIVQRLVYDEEKGISGNNRTGDKTDIIFEEILKSEKLLTGDRDIDNTADIKGAGYKVFLIKKGLVSAILFFIFYMLVANCAENRKYALGFVFLVVITFIQAHYPSSYSWLIPFFLIVGEEKKLLSE